jgi:hypothetical protein
MLPWIKIVLNIMAAAFASAITEAGRKTHEARVGRYRNHPHGWRPPDETGEPEKPKGPITGEEYQKAKDAWIEANDQLEKVDLSEDPPL